MISALPSDNFPANSAGKCRMLPAIAGNCNSQITGNNRKYALTFRRSPDSRHLPAVDYNFLAHSRKITPINPSNW